jgi:multisubunit Na+/H+ antiporter MnhC subunit
MSAATLAGLVGAALVGLGLYGLVINPQPLRKILAFNLVGSSVFCCSASSLVKARQPGSPPILCRRRW